MGKSKETSTGFWYLQDQLKLARAKKCTSFIVKKEKMAARHVSNSDVIDFCASHKISCRPEKAYFNEGTPVSWTITLA